jgi:hypothetical protein
MRLGIFWLAVIIAALAAGCTAQPGSKNPGSQSTAPETSAPTGLVLTQETAAGLKQYQGDVGSTGHGYFAVATDGGTYGYWFCPVVNCTGARAELKSKALSLCDKNNDGRPCVILAEDQTIVLPYRAIPIALPPLDETTAPATQAAGPRPPAPPADQLAKDGRLGWTVDSLHGCWIWNWYPDRTEVTWTGLCAPDGPATGEGVLEWKDKQRYVGEMKNGRKDGRGKMVNASGDIYEGTYKNGALDGKGVYAWGDGARYEGEYKDGKETGFGVFTFEGKTYSGQWVDGCFNDGTKRYRILNDDVASCPNW